MFTQLDPLSLVIILRVKACGHSFRHFRVTLYEKPFLLAYSPFILEAFIKHLLCVRTLARDQALVSSLCHFFQFINMLKL